MGHKVTREQIIDVLQSTGVEFQETQLSSNQYQFRQKDGWVVNWWESTGTVSFQGRGDGKLKLTIEEKLGQGHRPSKVFVVYGRDLDARKELELVLHRMDVEPVILEKLASEGQTLIEKLEKHLDPCDFVCVLLTPDDRGGLIGEDANEYRPRARQNVILELGWAIGSLGRNRVAMIRKNSVDIPSEQPSDLHGIVELRYDKSVEEIQHPLAKELNAAGFEINFSKL